METNHEDTHINESILSEEILEDQKKNRIDHMTYLPGMEDIGSEILDPRDGTNVWKWPDGTKSGHLCSA